MEDVLKIQRQESKSSLVEKHRTMVDDPALEIRRSVLAGAFASGLGAEAWRAPSSMLAVFVSSTFTDTQLERSYLLDELLFELRNEARPHGMTLVLLAYMLLSHYL
jgi:uncharacterized caspase-like protein